jgi:hypothetical protein
VNGRFTMLPSEAARFVGEMFGIAPIHVLLAAGTREVQP